MPSTPSPEQRIKDLEEKLQEKQEVIERYQARDLAAGKASRWSLKVIRYMFLGPTLAYAVEKLILESPNFSKATLSKAIGAAIRRLALMAFIGFVCIMIPPILLMVQNKKIERQNELFDLQNERIEIQSRLAEANRRSSLNYMLGQILGQVNVELNNQDTLSDPLIARIIGLSHSLAPYYFYESTDSLSEYLSPERGQLLISLINISSLDTLDLDKIYAKATFQNADLRNADLRQAYLANAYLPKANLSSADMTQANLTGAYMHEANLFDALFSNSSLRSANLIEANLSDAHFIRSNLSNAEMAHAIFNGAFFRKTVLADAGLIKADFQDARFIDMQVDSADLHNRGALFEGATFEVRKTLGGK
jgi:uncharacterized protein YjbI with pentapeptide repeats